MGVGAVGKALNEVGIPKTKLDALLILGGPFRILGKIGVAFEAEGKLKQTTLLGENMMKRVIPFADKTNARTLPFGTTNEKWAKMTFQERWKLNDSTLRALINEGDSFRYIGEDILRNSAIRKEFNLTSSELLRLNEQGISYEIVSPMEVMTVLGRP